MARQETDWDENETKISTASSDLSQTAAKVPGLTILAHPDWQRVGERLALPALAAGGEVRLSRIEPVFQVLGRAQSAPPRPLEERHLSRQPIRLTGGEELGSVAVDAGGTRTLVEVDGVSFSGQRVFTRAELDSGVVLLLGRRVVLLLHRMEAESPNPVSTENHPSFGLIGESVAMVRLHQEIRRLAPLDVPALLLGETGTGKELVARALHEAGPRHDRPYVVVNMGALNPSLAAAELFGAVRGAYTGADRQKAGFFQSAQHGTLFLDEIGETPVEVQVMLLRALESREIQPVGSVETRQVDVRVIAATDARLEEAVAAGRFRAPLYHRLAGYAVHLPALRERRDDVGRLFYFFLAEELAKLGEAGLDETGRSGDERPWPAAEIVARLARHDWPGNVRELKNVARRLAIAGTEMSMEVLLAQLENPMPGGQVELPAATEPSTIEPSTIAKEPVARRRRRKTTEVSEKDLLDALQAHAYKMRETAEALGLSRINFYRRIEMSSNVRKAADLEGREIEAALAVASGDLPAAAMALRVSLQGLKRRMTALGFRWP